MADHGTVFILRFKNSASGRGEMPGAPLIPRGLTVSGVIARVPRLLASKIEVETTGTKAG